MVESPSLWVTKNHMDEHEHVQHPVAVVDDLKGLSQLEQFRGFMK